jgi:hypothetical protein
MLWYLLHFLYRCRAAEIMSLVKKYTETIASVQVQGTSSWINISSKMCSMYYLLSGMYCWSLRDSVGSIFYDKEHPHYIYLVYLSGMNFAPGSLGGKEDILLYTEKKFSSIVRNKLFNKTVTFLQIVNRILFCYKFGGPKMLFILKIKMYTSAWG